MAVDGYTGWALLNSIGIIHIDNSDDLWTVQYGGPNPVPTTGLLCLP